jgi:trigger factor
MKHSIKKIEESKVEAVVEVEPELWKNAQKKAFDKLAGQVTVPGFRKGKAPEDMLKGKIDPNKIFDEAINDILPSVFGELVNDEKLRPFARPEVNVTKLSDTDLELKFVITLVPEVTLGQYKDLHARKRRRRSMIKKSKKPSLSA